jgi:hypothetical protein
MVMRVIQAIIFILIFITIPVYADSEEEGIEHGKSLEGFLKEI